MNPLNWTRRRIIFWGVWLFLLSRLAVLFFSIDEVFNSEDLAMGVAAKEALNGPSLPLSEYQYLTYSPGTLITGLMAVPFFILFGSNYLALKLVPLFFSTLTLAMLFLFAERFFSRRAAIIAAFLYIFSSFSWCGFNLYLGFHTESLLFMFLALYLFYTIVFANKEGWFYYLLLGLVSGFGLYFSYTFLVIQALIVIIWFIHNRGFFLKRVFLIYLTGFLIGFSPWIIYNLSCGFRGIIDVLPQAAEGGDYPGIMTWIKLPAYFLRSLWFPGILWVSFLDNPLFSFYNAGYTAFYWFCWGYIMRGGIKKLVFSREFPILLFPLLLFAACRFYGEGSLSTHLIEERYLITLFPFVFLTIAIAGDKLLPRVYFLKSAVIFGLCLFGIVGTGFYLRRIEIKNFASGLKQPGYSYFYLAETFNYRHRDDFYRILDNISRMAAPQKYETLTLRLVFDLEDPIKKVDLEQYLRLAGRFERRYQPYFYRLLFNGLYYNSGLGLKDLIAEVKTIAPKIGPEYRPYLYEGTGAVMLKRYFEDNSVDLKAEYLLEPECLAHYYRGLSASIYTDDIPAYLNRCKDVLEQIEDRYRPYYLDGVGEVLAKFGVTTFIAGLSYDNPGLIALYDFIGAFEQRDRDCIMKGIGGGIDCFYSENTKEDIERFIVPLVKK